MGFVSLLQSFAQESDVSALGIVAALPAEVRCLADQPAAAGSLVRLQGDTLVQLCGLGTERARLAAEFLVERGATCLLSWGCAGGLGPAISPGSLVLPKTVIALDQSTFSTDSAWHSRLFSRLNAHLDLHTEPLVQSSEVLKSPAEKAAFFEDYGAIAVDMESASVAQVANELSLPFVAIRAVSDPRDAFLPASALAALDESGSFRPIRFLWKLARRPGEIPLLVNLRRNFRAAQATLAKVVRLTGIGILAF